MRRQSFIVLIPLCLMLIGCNFSGFRATAVTEQTTAHLPGSPVVVETRNGSIEIMADSTIDEVQVSARITAGGTSQSDADDRLARTVLKVERDTSRALAVTVTFPEPRRMNDGARITVRLPEADGVTATTSNGTITITGTGGALAASTSNGRIEVADHHGEARITTSNGSVRVERHAGHVSVRTSNGSVRISDHGGGANVQTSNGRIELALAPDQPGPIDLRTSNGRIVATVGPAFAGEVSLNTSNASLSVSDSASLIAAQSLARRSGTVKMQNEGQPSRLSTSNGRITFTTTGG